jgi:hypothetical protein
MGTERAARLSRSGSPSQLGIAGTRKQHCGEAEQAEGEEARVAIERSTPTGDERGAEDEQEVGDDAPGEGAADDLGQALVDGDQGDDELGRVPERRVEEAADARPGVLGRVFRRLSDQPGEWDEGDGGEHELRGLGKVCAVVERDDERSERERREENSSDHGAETYPAAAWERPVAA